MKQYGEILYQNVVVTGWENEWPVVYTQDTTITKHINVVCNGCTNPREGC